MAAGRGGTFWGTCTNRGGWEGWGSGPGCLMEMFLGTGIPPLLNSQSNPHLWGEEERAGVMGEKCNLTLLQSRALFLRSFKLVQG